MADVFVVEVLNSFKNLTNNCSQLLFFKEFYLIKAWEGQIFHDKVGSSFPSVEVEPFVLADEGVIQLFQGYEILADVADVLFFKIELLFRNLNQFVN